MRSSIPSSKYTPRCAIERTVTPLNIVWTVFPLVFLCPLMTSVGSIVRHQNFLVGLLHYGNSHQIQFTSSPFIKRKASSPVMFDSNKRESVFVWFLCPDDLQMGNIIINLSERQYFIIINLVITVYNMKCATAIINTYIPLLI